MQVARERTLHDAFGREGLESRRWNGVGRALGHEAFHVIRSPQSRVAAQRRGEKERLGTGTTLSESPPAFP